MKIGLLGGSFNPIHTGHLILAMESLRKLALDKVILMPANIPPHKIIEDDVTPKDRLKMAQLAIKGYKEFEVSDYEIKKEGLSYTVDTVKYYADKFGPETDLFFITGFDSLAELKKWKDINTILSLTKFVVARRPGYNPEDLFENRRIHLLDIPQVDISSTMIRNRVKRGGPIDFLLPAEVEKYIRKKKLYM